MKRLVAFVVAVTLGALSPVTAAEGLRPVRKFWMPGSSMRPTIEVGDVFLAYAINEPKRGDVVVFTPPGKDFPLVMRLVGLPGDRVQMRGGTLVLDGEAVQRVDEGPGPAQVCWKPEPPRRIRETLPGGRTYLTYDCESDAELDETPQFVVPPGHYFLLGDHRDNSLDSRVSSTDGGVGFVPAKNLIGFVVSITPSRERRAAGASRQITIE